MPPSPKLHAMRFCTILDFNLHKLAPSRHYNGTRLHPSIPLPPQFRRGVSCISTDSDGPAVLGRNALTMMGSCGRLASSTQLRHDVQPESSRVLGMHVESTSATHPFVLRHHLGESCQLVVVCPVHPSKLGYAVAYLQASCLGRATCHDAVDLCERCFQSRRSTASAECGESGGVVLGLLLQSCVVLVEALLDARHELLVVVLQPYYARARGANCKACQSCLRESWKVCHTLSNVDICAWEAVKRGKGRVHGNTVLEG